VFRNQRLVGYAAVAQLTVGVQLGAQTYGQVIEFESEQALARWPSAARNPSTSRWFSGGTEGAAQASWSGGQGRRESELASEVDEDGGEF
jgi:hypothetical protein